MTRARTSKRLRVVFFGTGLSASRPGWVVSVVMFNTAVVLLGDLSSSLKGFISLQELSAASPFLAPLHTLCRTTSLYKRGGTEKERLRGEEPITQFGRMCAKLGIELIAASSPQAKGRVERVHGTHQDRLVKKMRRKQIASQAEANAYLEAEYLPEHNRRFAREAARPEDYHRRAPGPVELNKMWFAKIPSA